MTASSRDGTSHDSRRLLRFSEAAAELQRQTGAEFMLRVAPGRPVPTGNVSPFDEERLVWIPRLVRDGDGDDDASVWFVEDRRIWVEGRQTPTRKDAVVAVPWPDPPWPWAAGRFGAVVLFADVAEKEQVASECARLLRERTDLRDAVLLASLVTPSLCLQVVAEHAKRSALTEEQLVTAYRDAVVGYVLER